MCRPCGPFHLLQRVSNISINPTIDQWHGRHRFWPRRPKASLPPWTCRFMQGEACLHSAIPDMRERLRREGRGRREERERTALERHGLVYSRIELSEHRQGSAATKGSKPARAATDSSSHVPEALRSARATVDDLTIVSRSASPCCPRWLVDR